MNGIINVYKEAGYTSHDVVARLRGICRQKKIGHTGTLDPQATGVLPVCLGNATKVCDLLTDKDKEYVAELLLGVETDTQDTTGQVLRERKVEASQEQISEAILGFQGHYSQIPPMYSALKVNGRKLYELARAGQEVERKAREVTIHQMEILEWNLPVVKIRVACSKGTYIRTLCADIGEKLGCGGTMKSLLRTRVGRFTAEEALTLGELEAMQQENRLEEILLPVDEIFQEAPSLHVKDGFGKLLENGNSLYPEQMKEERTCQEGEWVRIYRTDGSFAGIYTYDGGRKWYKPVKMFLG